MILTIGALDYPLGRKDFEHGHPVVEREFRCRICRVRYVTPKDRWLVQPRGASQPQGLTRPPAQNPGCCLQTSQTIPSDINFTHLPNHTRFQFDKISDFKALFKKNDQAWNREAKRFKPKRMILDTHQAITRMKITRKIAQCGHGGFTHMKKVDV